MDAILIIFAICLFGVLFTVMIFAIAMRPVLDEEEEPPQPRPSPPPEDFFLEDRDREVGGPGSPSNPLLVQLEHHVRAEHGAASTFLRMPNPETLHAPSDSTLSL